MVPAVPIAKMVPGDSSAHILLGVPVAAHCLFEPAVQQLQRHH